MKLAQLKMWYNLYGGFWTQWKEYKYNGLTPRDIVAIEIFRDNDFKMDTIMLEKFYQKLHISEKLIEPLVIKLGDNYAEYKEWVSIRFQLSLVKYATRYGVEEFLQLPINELPINEEDKKNLKMFNCDTIDEINRKYTPSDFIRESMFKYVIKFRDFILNAPNEELFALEEIFAIKSENYKRPVYRPFYIQD